MAFCSIFSAEKVSLTSFPQIGAGYMIHWVVFVGFLNQDPWNARFLKEHDHSQISIPWNQIHVFFFRFFVSTTRSKKTCSRLGLDRTSIGVSFFSSFYYRSFCFFLASKCSRATSAWFLDERRHRKCAEWRPFAGRFGGRLVLSNSPTSGFLSAHQRVHVDVASRSVRRAAFSTKTLIKKATDTKHVNATADKLCRLGRAGSFLVARGTNYIHFFSLKTFFCRVVGSRTL